jgi:hypothetical protein
MIDKNDDVTMTVYLYALIGHKVNGCVPFDLSLA